jgi:hypothetical protein
MKKSAGSGLHHAGLSRRGFLATGAMAAAGGALAPMSRALALESNQAMGAEAPRIERVFPLAGAEGDDLFVLGQGFDPDPEKSRIVLGDGRAKVEVVAAAPGYLVGRIGPVTAADLGELRVLIGEPVTCGDTAVDCQGMRSVATGRRAFAVRSAAAAPERFQLVRRSPFAAEGGAPAGLEVELAAGPARRYRGARVEIWSSSGLADSFALQLAGAGAAPEGFAAHLARHLQESGAASGLGATARGTRVALSRAAGAAGWLRIDLRTTAESGRGAWFSSWSGRLA